MSLEVAEEQLEKGSVLLSGNLKIKDIKTSKLFRPYGTKYHLPITGRTYITINAEYGAKINTWVYVVNYYKESSLLDELDAVSLGIVTINLKGASAKVTFSNKFGSIQIGPIPE